MSFKQMFGQVVNFAASSIPTTDAYAYKVRNVDNVARRFKDWPVICTADSMQLFHDVKNKQYEAVLTINRPDGKQEAYSLFKKQAGDKTLAEFVLFHEKLHPFYQSCPMSISLTNLQALCTVIREHPEWSVAHIAVAAKIKGCYRVPEIRAELNSQQCNLQQTPLHLAVESGQAEVVQELLLCNVIVDVPDVNGENVFHAAAKLPTEVTDGIITPLSQDSTGINRTNNNGLLPLHLALQMGNFNLALRFINLGSRSDIPDELGYPIHYAMKHSQIKIVQAIFKANKSQGKVVCSKHGGTPLHWAKTVNMMEIILKEEHSLDALSRTGDSALHVMIKRLRLECIITLLCAGADVNSRGPDGDTALHLAVKKNNLDLVYCLVTFGADVNLQNKKRETPRHIASSQFLSTISSYVGSSLEMLSVLHLIGAKRCEAIMTGCSKGCKQGGTYDGKPPDAMSFTPSATYQLYDDFLALSIGTLLAAKAIKTDTVDGPIDTVDAPMDINHSLQKQERLVDTILCLDGGGIRGLILVQMLIAIEKAAGRKIIDMFDWIAGTSTGGILALGLIHGYSVAQCKQIYFGLKNAVFFGSRPYSSENFEKYLKEAFGEETKMNSVQYPRVMVSGTMGDRNPPALHFFRNFEPPSLSSARLAAYTEAYEKYKPPPEPKDQLVWRAARSSGAAPSYFRSLGRFLDGGLIANNPTVDALTEVTEFYMEKKIKGEPFKKIGAVLSLGTGDPPVKRVNNIDILRPENPLDLANSVMGAANLGDIFIEQCTETRGRSVDRSRAWCNSIGAAYFRFSPALSSNMALDEARDPVLFRMLWETEVYIRRNEDKFQQLADLLTSL